MLRVWNCLDSQHDWSLVLLAGVVCFLTSISAMSLFRRGRAGGRGARVVWILAAGSVTGGGVWATHFIAMLAYVPGFAIKYDLTMTFLSLAVAVIMTTAGFAMALLVDSKRGAIAGGAMLGVGVACMHYLGMGSLITHVEIVWLGSYVVASILLGVVFSALSLLVERRGDGSRTLAAAATLLTFSILSHHFVGMSAINVIRESAFIPDGNLLSHHVLSLAIAAIAATMVVGGWIGAVSDRQAGRTIGERNMQLGAALDNMAQGLCMFDRDGRLQLWNEAYLHMYLIPRKEIFAGCEFEHLMEVRTVVGTAVKDIAQHRIDESKAVLSSTANNLVTELVDGRMVSVTYRQMQNGGWVSTHEDITLRLQNEARIAHLALYDPLTDLPNRAAFNDFIKKTLREAEAERGSFVVARIGADRFKEINDVFGQSIGDAVLSNLAQKFKAICHGAFMARAGGDEFTMVSFPVPVQATAEAVCEQLSGMLNNDVQIGDRTVRVGCTIGVSIYPQDGADVETLVANADVALYRAKHEERGTIRFFEPAMDRQVRDKRLLQRDLVAALENNEFQVYFQPQATAKGTIVAFEALVRWRHRERGLVSPGVFIPLAEEIGLISAIDEWVLREACREAASWPSPLSVAINLSPVDFRRCDVPNMILSALLETGLSPSRLEIEITEGVLIEDTSRAMAILRRIKSLGVRVALDDFGTGYSSLSYLQAFPFDKIKIDQTFIAKLDLNAHSAAIIRAIIGLGRSLGLPVIAEGVETEKQLAFLAAEGCGEVQGYLIGRPQPIEHYRDIVNGCVTGPQAVALAV
jgi:diguanylate cyclase